MDIRVSTKYNIIQATGCPNIISLKEDLGQLTEIVSNKKVVKKLSHI